MIKNIIFDLSEVIISGYHGIEQLIEQKYKIMPKEFKERKQETIEMFLETMRGNLTEEAYWREFLKEVDWKVTVEDLKATIRENLNQPVKGTLEIVKRCKKNYALILLTDHVREWLEYIEEKNEEIKIFDKIIVSYKIGALKSDPFIFETILKENLMIPEETIFIDDNQKNIEKAEEAGIHGILFENAKQLKEELKEKYHIILE